MILLKPKLRLYQWNKNRHKLLKIITLEIIVVAALVLVFGYISSTNSYFLLCQEGYIQIRNQCVPEERETNFFDLMKSKAHIVFNMKLEELEITPEKFTIQSGLKTDDEKEFFMAEVIADDNNRYYLTTIFYHAEPLDQIEVTISKIISPKCNQENIMKGQGCNPKYLAPIGS